MQIRFFKCNLVPLHRGVLRLRLHQGVPVLRLHAAAQRRRGGGVPRSPRRQGTGRGLRGGVYEFELNVFLVYP
jgi:hypothetical protein